METAVTPPADIELHLLTSWGDASDPPRRRKAGILSVALHVAAIGTLAMIPKSWLEAPVRVVETRIISPLIEPPPAELTQKAPNKGKINRELNLAATQPRPRIQMPPSAAPASRPQPFRPVPLPPAPAPKPIALPEPPKIQATETKPAPPLPLPEVAPPQIQTVEKPKLAFETPSQAPAPEPGQGKPLPRVTAADAAMGALRGAAGQGGYGNAVDLPPSPGTQPNNMQLLSDPMGVDFRPYLTQVLTAVKRNWMRVWPESARMGRTGKVSIQFSIDRRGMVPKLVIATPSGVDSLDRAAIAAISQTVPFPPLPTQFRGDLIKLQMNFNYFIPK